jgi:hypothetical protein
MVHTLKRCAKVHRVLVKHALVLTVNNPHLAMGVRRQKDVATTNSVGSPFVGV